MSLGKEDRLIIEAYNIIYESDYDYSSASGPNGEYLEEYFDKFIRKYDPMYLPTLVNNIFEGEHPAREAMATSSLDPATGIVKEIHPNDKNMTIEQAKEMLFNWWCSTYEHNFEYTLDEETMGEDEGWVAHSDIRSIVLKELKYTLDNFAVDYHVWKKQKDVKDIISKNNQSGWDV